MQVPICHYYSGWWLEPDLYVLLQKRLPPVQNLIQQHAIGVDIAGLGGSFPPQELRGSPVGGLVTLPVQEQLSLFWRLQGQQDGGFWPLQRPQNRGRIAVSLNTLPQQCLMTTPGGVNSLQYILLRARPCVRWVTAVVSPP